MMVRRLGRRRRASADHSDDLKRAAAKAGNPPSDKQVEYLASLMRRRGEPAAAVLGDDGELDSALPGKPFPSAKEAGHEP